MTYKNKYCKVYCNYNLTGFHKKVNSEANGLCQSTSEKSNLSIDYKSAQVENFLISDKPYQQLSDHFGLTVDLKFS